MRRATHIGGIVALLALAIGGCGSTGTRATGTSVGTPAPRVTTHLPAVVRPHLPGADRFAHGVPATKTLARRVPPAPGSAGAVAAASIQLVSRLHNLAAARVHPVALPPGVLGSEASELHDQLLRLRAKVSLTSTGADARLAAALTGYAALADGLGRHAGPTTDATARRLAALDHSWRTALREIGSASHVNLVATIPPLLSPTMPPPAPAQPRRAH